MNLYAELAVMTNFSFLRGASHADELIDRAAELGIGAVSCADLNSLAGIVRAHVAAKQAGIPLVIGARVRLVEPRELDVLVHATDRALELVQEGMSFREAYDRVKARLA